MQQKELAEMTDQELLEEAKKVKSSSITHAVIIGFLAGIVIFSVATNSWGFFTLIPLYFIFRVFINNENNKRNKALMELLKERNLA